MISPSTTAFRERLQEVEARLERLEAIRSEEDRACAAEAVQAVLQLHGEVLSRLLGQIAGHERGEEVLIDICRDETIAGLLILHGVHPQSLEERLEAALGSVRPYLGSHGGDVELVSAEGGVVRLRLRGSCSGCPSSAATLQFAVEEALRKAAPDLVAIEVEDATQDASPSEHFIPLARVKPLQRRPASSWTTVGPVDQVASGQPMALEVGGARVLVVRLGENCWAYSLRCPACAHSLEGARLDGEALVCPGCGDQYGLRTAGRSATNHQQLRPIPLLVEDGLLQVATAALVA
jgi:Fe-S cluster biogenesis protein NfuA/nitrite reductase/ring-hydroxylating ferredoxin subunit